MLTPLKLALIWFCAQQERHLSQKRRLLWRLEPQTKAAASTLQRVPASSLLHRQLRMAYFPCIRPGRHILQILASCMRRNAC